jgi:hypothetical protein
LDGRSRGRRKKSVDDWLKRLDAFHASEPDESLPEFAYFHDLEHSWQVYRIMEAYSDEWGNWRFLPSQVLNEEQSLMDDLTTWRWLGGIVKRLNRKESADE